MREKAKMLLVVLVVFSVSVCSIFTISMVGKVTPGAYSASPMDINDVMDICMLTNTNIETGQVDWDGFWLCVGIMLS